MTDQPEKKSETEDDDADFEGHRLSGAGASRASDITDVKGTTTTTSADFEGHRLDEAGREDRQIGKLS